MPTDYWIPILIAVLLSTTAARFAPLNDQEARLRFEEHYNRTKAFQCKEPQNRAYLIKSVLPQGQIAPNLSIFPTYTVMRRCDDGAGCCRAEDQSCRPVNTTYEDVLVRVTNVVDNHTSTSIRTLQIEHHTKCECRKSPAPPLSPPKVRLV